MINNVKQRIMRNQYHGLILFDTLCTMVAATVLTGALIRLVLILWASAGATMQSTRSFQSIVRIAHEFQERRGVSSSIKHKEIFFESMAARLGPYALHPDQSISVVMFGAIGAKGPHAFTTAYVH